MGIRRRGREYALQMLYAMDVNEYLPEEVFQGFKTIQDLNQEAFANAKTLVLGVHQHHEIIDRMIQNFAEHWKIARMVVVDRNLLRLGLYELMHCLPIPSSSMSPSRSPKNSAIRIALNFSTVFWIRLASIFGRTTLWSVVDQNRKQIPSPRRLPRWKTLLSDSLEGFLDDLQRGRQNK